MYKLHMYMVEKSCSPLNVAAEIDSIRLFLTILKKKKELQ